jgi:PPK2 family polyphosphate:nucleotide phosphotransferase
VKIDIAGFRVGEGSRVDLEKFPTDVSALYRSGGEYREALEKKIEKIDEAQQLLYASGKWSVLFILQAMDAAGKDSAIRHVFSGINPQGCSVHSFKTPSSGELAHDFLWRTTCQMPERGRIGIFNRSYYEEVLVVRVHPEYLANENLPESLADEKRLWRQRYASIGAFEHHMAQNGTKIAKIFLHVSRAEQKKRLLARIDDPAKNWKFSNADLAERALWKKYERAYEECLATTSTAEAPWYVVPADDKKNAHLLVAEIVRETLKSLKMRYPEVSEERKAELAVLREKLAEDK